MLSQTTPSLYSPEELTRQMLQELNIPLHRIGYRYLCMAVPMFAVDGMQSLSKELYPRIAAQYGAADWRAVERSIRIVILDAWEHRDPEVWSRYFPRCERAPSNKRFLAVLAEQLG